MIEKERLSSLLLEACPSFKATYDASKDKDLDYMIASAFARHLLNLYKANKTEEFSKVSELIENLHVAGDDYVKEYATIGILEDIQNIWGNDKTDPEKFAAFLLPVSLKYWHSLNKFWKGGIPIVGSDIENEE